MSTSKNTYGNKDEKLIVRKIKAVPSLGVFRRMSAEDKKNLLVQAGGRNDGQK